MIDELPIRGTHIVTLQGMTILILFETKVGNPLMVQSSFQTAINKPLKSPPHSNQAIKVSAITQCDDLLA